jgi:cation transport ATPase
MNKGEDNKMSEKDCGNCDYQGEGMEQKKVECRVDGKWHERGYKCEDFKEYVQGKNVSVRVTQSTEKKRERETKASEQSRREFEEKESQKNRDHAAELTRKQMEQAKKLWMASWWWQIILIFIGAALGYAVTLLVKS